ncbi:hypothetical protein IFM89_005113 [Coptis chinensis]|uniref:Uncharacterized protein n=1 Tax=Coptis chinensis TaxID=261450 RepID=A0A835IKY8_9MAGN|nr:hypothetical protein IFM89_005113 [Coptis chinensis]
MAYLAQGRGSFLHFALYDAEDCIKLRPDWPEAYYRDGVALSLLKDFDKAVEKLLLGLKLDPGNKDLRVAFKKAVEAKMNSSLRV